MELLNQPFTILHEFVQDVPTILCKAVPRDLNQSLAMAASRYTADTTHCCYSTGSNRQAHNGRSTTSQDHRIVIRDSQAPSDQD